LHKNEWKFVIALAIVSASWYVTGYFTGYDQGVKSGKYSAESAARVRGRVADPGGSTTKSDDV